MQGVRGRHLHPLLHKHGGYFANARFFLLGVFLLLGGDDGDDGDDYDDDDGGDDGDVF